MAVTDTIIDIIRSWYNGTTSLKTKLQDGAGTDLTSTLVSGKQSLDVNVTSDSSGNAAAGATGGPVPSSADYVGYNSGGNLVGVSTATPLPVAQQGSITASVSNFPATQAISAASLPLPLGASTAALQTQPGVDIGDVTINNASGAGAVNIQDGGNTITVDGSVAATQSGTWTVQPGNIANTTAWKVDGSAVTQPVSGTVGISGTIPTTLTGVTGQTTTGSLTNTGDSFFVPFTFLGQNAAISLSWGGAGLVLLQTSDDAVNWQNIYAASLSSVTSSPFSSVQGIPGQTDHFYIPGTCAYTRLYIPSAIPGSVSISCFVKSIGASLLSQQNVNLTSVNSSPVTGNSLPVNVVSGDIAEYLNRILQELKTMKLAVIAIATEGQRARAQDFKSYASDDVNSDVSN